MRALIFDGSEPRFSTSHPAPEPAPGEAVIRTLLAGVGATELAVCHGMMGFSGVLGSEFVGVVERVEGTDDRALTGRRVVGGASTFCGTCDMCQAGLSAHCRNRTLLGLQGRDGCLADRFVLPVANLVPVPDGIDDDHAVFAEPLAGALQAVRQLTIEGKPYITVLGDGVLGLLMVQVMAKLNASVRLVGRTPSKLAVCERLGIKHRHVDDVGRRADQDIVVDCSGTVAGLQLALRLVRPRGTVVLKSLAPATPAGADLVPAVLNEISLIGSSGGPIRESILLLGRREVDVTNLVTRRVSLDDGTAILAYAARPEQIKVVVRVEK